MTDREWHREMWKLIPVEGYTAIPRLSVACAVARPWNGWVDARGDLPLLAPHKRPLVMECYEPTFQRARVLHKPRRNAKTRSKTRGIGW